MAFGQWRSRNKYNAVRITSSDGRSFSSKLEAATYAHLKTLEESGELKILQCQDHVKLTRAEILYIPDFKLLDIKTNTIFWAESKGIETSDWRIKKRLWAKYGPGILWIFKGSHTKLKLVEIINPDNENKPE